MRRRLLLGGGLVTALLIGPLAGIGSAQTIEEVATAANEMWLVLAAALVMLMQAGFALVEAGFTRAKNAGNIIMKNVMDFAVGGLMYWAIGFGLAYGGTSVGGWFAYGDFFFNNAERGSEWLFQVVFAATAATIISGAVAGRVKFKSYLIYTPFITGLIYPVVTHWTWGGGWLAELGYTDFAGSGIVHMLGGVAALAGVIVVGPRIGKYDENGKPKAIPGHSLTLGALGVQTEALSGVPTKTMMLGVDDNKPPLRRDRKAARLVQPRRELCARRFPRRGAAEFSCLEHNSIFEDHPQKGLASSGRNHRLEAFKAPTPA